MREIDEIILNQQEEIRKVKLGHWQGDLDKLEARLVELRQEREAQFHDYLKARALVEGMVKPVTRPPDWYQPMSPDNYLNARGEICTQKYPPMP